VTGAAASPPRIAVSAHDLSIRYPSRHPETSVLPVNGVDFTLHEGEILAVVGETGSGKSTLAATVAGHVGLGEAGIPVIHGGSLRVLGKEMRGISRRTLDRVRFNIGYLPQDAGSYLTPRLTVGENVAMPIFERDRNFNGTEAGKAVATLIDSVRLPLGMMNKYPHELSRGQRQRVAIAKALILEPTVFVADDPTSGIDVMVRDAILETIRDLQTERAFSALVVTPDLREVRFLSQRVLVMHRSVVVGHGLIDDVLDHPIHSYVEGLAEAWNHDTSTVSLHGN
jgi:peptide/nickel transport system ATP-binding protein